jgi:hypothetical protein
LSDIGLIDPTSHDVRYIPPFGQDGSQTADGETEVIRVKCWRDPELRLVLIKTIAWLRFRQRMLVREVAVAVDKSRSQVHRVLKALNETPNGRRLKARVMRAESLDSLFE